MPPTRAHLLPRLRAASSAPFATAASSPGTTTWTSSCRATTTNSSSPTSTRWRTSKNYALTFCRNDTSVYQFVKIIDTRTSVKERYVSASYKTGVWVDIFPLDGIPKDAKRVFLTQCPAHRVAGTRPVRSVKRHNTPAQARKETARPHSEENGSRTLFPADR